MKFTGIPRERFRLIEKRRRDVKGYDVPLPCAQLDCAHRVRDFACLRSSINSSCRLLSALFAGLLDRRAVLQDDRGPYSFAHRHACPAAEHPLRRRTQRDDRRRSACSAMHRADRKLVPRVHREGAGRATKRSRSSKR
jgi:hypothetical protein